MGRLSTDPKVLQDLLGFNGIFPTIAVFNVIGCVAISFTYGWKLTVVILFSAMPVILVAFMIRIRFDLKFEEWNNQVFSQSSQFANEAIGAFRTVTSLTMEDTIINKYETLLRDQIRKSTRKATYAALVFALSDSLELCSIALTFWSVNPSLQQPVPSSCQHPLTFLLTGTAANSSHPTNMNPLNSSSSTLP